MIAPSKHSVKQATNFPLSVFRGASGACSVADRPIPFLSPKRKARRYLPVDVRTCATWRRSKMPKGIALRTVPAPFLFSPSCGPP